MLYESKKHPLISRRRFLRRMAKHTVVASVLIVVSLVLGITGYMHYEHLDWIEALLNSAMLLGGMGPVDMPQTEGGKLFASFYALYAGFVLLAAVGFLMAPVAHRLLHRFHLAEEEGKGTN
jgi:uncharacterized protein involved in cysteine biosynthesis